VSQDVFGFIGGALVTAAYVPQVVKLFRLKSAHEISLPFTIILLIGIICWLVYGLVYHLQPVIIWNAATIVLLVALLYAKLKYG
jgi:MtN3 and saliva related transmembrane protein